MERDSAPEVGREHWTVPVRGLTGADLNGTVQAIPGRDGTVILHLTYGDSRTSARLDISRAAQLSTGIWEAASASQQLSWHAHGDQPPPLPAGSADEPVIQYPPAYRDAAPRSRSAKRQRTPSPVYKHDTAAQNALRAIGLRIRRIREARGKSLQVIAELIGTSAATLHHVEHGRRELSVTEIVALATALQIDPWELIKLPVFALTSGSAATSRRGAPARTS